MPGFQRSQTRWYQMKIRQGKRPRPRTLPAPRNLRSQGCHGLAPRFLPNVPFRLEARVSLERLGPNLHENRGSCDGFFRYRLGHSVRIRGRKRIASSASCSSSGRFALKTAVQIASKTPCVVQRGATLTTHSANWSLITPCASPLVLQRRASESRLSFILYLGEENNNK